MKFSVADLARDRKLPTGSKSDCAGASNERSLVSGVVLALVEEINDSNSAISMVNLRSFMLIAFEVLMGLQFLFLAMW